MKCLHGENTFTHHGTSRSRRTHCSTYMNAWWVRLLSLWGHFLSRNSIIHTWVCFNQSSNISEFYFFDHRFERDIWSAVTRICQVKIQSEQTLNHSHTAYLYIRIHTIWYIFIAWNVEYFYKISSSLAVVSAPFCQNHNFNQNLWQSSWTEIIIIREEPTCSTHSSDTYTELKHFV